MHGTAEPLFWNVTLHTTWQTGLRSHVGTYCSLCCLNREFCRLLCSICLKGTNAFDCYIWVWADLLSYFWGDKKNLGSRRGRFMLFHVGVSLAWEFFVGRKSWKVILQYVQDTFVEIWDLFGFTLLAKTFNNLFRSMLGVVGASKRARERDR